MIWVIRLIIVSSALISFVVKADELTIRWIMHTEKPWYIQSGPLVNQGSGNLFLAKIQAGLPQYQHESVVRTIPRGLAEMKRQNACALGYYKTIGRVENYYFSEPYSILIEPYLLTSKKGHEIANKYLDADKRVDLKGILQDPSSVLLRISARSYGTQIDDILTQFGNPKQQIRAAEWMKNDKKLLMLQRERANISLFYPAELEMFERLGSHVEGLTLLPLADEYTETHYTYIICSKNAWGQAVLQDINRVIKAVREDQDFQAAILNWQPSHVKDVYISRLKKAFDSPTMN